MSVVLQEVHDDTYEWQVPRFEADAQKRLAWVEEQIQEAEGFLSTQKAYQNLSQSMRIFDGIFNDKSKSTLNSNTLKYNIRKFVETISNVREIGTYGSDAVQFKPYAEIENRVAKAIYTESQYPRQLRKALQYATVMGIGYLWAKCKTENYGFGERRLVFEPLGLLDVLPIQVPMTNDVQDAYAVTIYDYMPIAEAHGRFPLYQSQLKPVDATSMKSRIAARRVDWTEKFRFGGEQTRNWGNLYCEMRYTFVRDLRINSTGHTLPMGDMGTSWYYEVPSVGQQIPAGVSNGQRTMRAARNEDCLVYPNLRLLISNRGINSPMYDGPAWDWFGTMPVVGFTVDDWPWEALGLSLVDNVGSIEQTKRKHERKIDVVLSTKLNPPLGYDRGATGGPKIENFDIFEENVRIGVDGKPKDIMQSVLPDEVQVTATNFEFVKLLADMEEKQLGLNDLGSLMNLRLNLGADGFDKAVEAIGPIAMGIAATMEAGNAKVGNMLKFMIAQWMDAKRIIEYIGPDQITPELFDYDPASLIPSHMPDEYVDAGGASVLPFRELSEGLREVIPSQYSQIERARYFARQLRLISVPSTLLKLTAAQEQTKYMALFGRGFPISPHTVAKKLGIDNFGEIPGSTEFEKWVNWKKLEIALMAEARQLAGQLGIGEPGGGTGKQHGGGRPPTDQKPGKFKMKDKNTNPRPIVSTSG
ncbi:MAG: hypothetical protein C5B60_07670 [Chloroflexi bacterium]|nr:MAG: hypothetical protein C5B60_07670 [Chloroflexota bacterium]